MLQAEKNEKLVPQSRFSHNIKMEKKYNLTDIIPEKLMDSCKAFSFEIKHLKVNEEDFFAELVTTSKGPKYLIVYRHLPTESSSRQHIYLRACDEFIRPMENDLEPFVIYFYSEAYMAFTKFDMLSQKVIKIFTIEKFLKHTGIYDQARTV